MYAKKEGKGEKIGEKQECRYSNKDSYFTHKHIKTMKKVTIIIPCYNEESRVRDTWEKLEGVLRSMNDVESQVVFVND